MRRIGAVTVHQPWAELIARGRKRTENRFYLPGLSIGDFIAVHAGKWQPRGATTKTAGNRYAGQTCQI